MNPYAAGWLEMESIFGPATRREQNVDARSNVNWDELEQITFGGAVAAGCALIERAGLKETNQHIKVIFELRNAFVHNNCDITKNKNTNAFHEASSYLSNQEYLQLSPDMTQPFFLLNGNMVEFKEDILFAIRSCLL